MQSKSILVDSILLLSTMVDDAVVVKLHFHEISVRVKMLAIRSPARQLPTTFSRQKFQKQQKSKQSWQQQYQQ